MAKRGRPKINDSVLAEVKSLLGSGIPPGRVIKYTQVSKSTVFRIKKQMDFGTTDITEEKNNE